MWVRATSALVSPRSPPASIICARADTGASIVRKAPAGAGPADGRESGSRNVDPDTVDGFGREWESFDQRAVAPDELDALFERYFSLFPWQDLPEQAVGFDLGCGSGRWAARVSARVGHLHCIDPSPQALEVARVNLRGHDNCTFHCATIAEIPLETASMDFGYSLGVLHHVPDTAADIARCARLLRPGAPLLLYLYYAFDNRPTWFRALWRASDIGRRALSRLPFPARRAACDAIAICVYWPLARVAAVLERAGVDVSAVPLSAYRRLSLYTMRTDALDRFGTRLEKRFTRDEIRELMARAGLRDVRFADDEPYWRVVARR